jgi:hypothetical protein
MWQFNFIVSQFLSLVLDFHSISNLGRKLSPPFSPIFSRGQQHYP